jgi:hypothetical protein
MSQPPDSQSMTRRTVMAGGIAAAALSAGAAAAQPATAEAGGATAHGLVFDETAGRRGIAGVMVSNGRDVVKTDADGRWSLPVRPGDAVFVIKPSGYMTPVDPVTQLPRFSYLYVPDGTPTHLGFRFPGIAPTGALPDSIDFALRPQTESASFNAILFTDPQPETLAEVGYVRDDVVVTTAGIDAAFGITHGDVAFDDLSFYHRYNSIVGTVGLPWYNCCGNHDMNLEAPDNVHSRETFKRVFGARYYAMQYGGTTFLLLDNVDYLGTDPAKPNAFGKYQGRFGADQLAFVRNVLANVPTDSLVVLSFHIPLRTLQGTVPAVMNVDTADLSSARPTATRPARTITMCWRPSRGAGGAARSMSGASRWRWKATAVRTASMSCRSTRAGPPRRWCRRVTRRAARCASCWTARCTGRTRRC